LRSRQAARKRASRFLSWDTEAGPPGRNESAANRPVCDRSTCAEVNLDGSDRVADRTCRGTSRDADLSTSDRRGTPELRGGRFLPPGDQMVDGVIVLGAGGRKRVEGLGDPLSFDPQITPHDRSSPAIGRMMAVLSLPAVISAPDFGQLLLAEGQGRRLPGRYGGKAAATSRWTLIVELPCAVLRMPSLKETHRASSAS